MQENTQPPIVSEAPIVKSVKTTNTSLTVILLLIILFLLGTTTFFAYQNMQLQKQISGTKTATSLSSTPDPTANWKTYSSNGFSFKYPSNLTDLKGQGGVSIPLDAGTQTVVNFGDNTTISQGTDAPYDGFSIYVTGKDARQSFTDYVNKKVEEQKNSPRGILSDKVTNLNINGHLVEYIEYANNIREYFIQPTDPTAVVVLIRINKTSTFLSVFDQILSTFQFTNSTAKDLNAIKNACISLEGTPVAWNDSLQECIDVKGTNVEIKSFCQQYGGNFVDNASAVCSFLSDISTWKTFTHSKDHYSLKYPSNMEAKSFVMDPNVQNADSVAIEKTSYTTGDTLMLISMSNTLEYKNQSYSNLQALAEAIYNSITQNTSSQPTVIRTVTQSNFANETSYEFSLNTKGISGFLSETEVPKGEYKFIITSHSGNYYSIISPILSPFDQILSSFQFTQ